ncbi:hypothetical protein GS399_08710 [Pedobacter sp. HMF7647]|uniref:Ribbon-helix-helix protein, CopG family n=1 Tax=Hufsiella arboris TaxID=2695275 RepID=A0A7K1YAF0_9SPHI|nr:hypothetical protein [Hufsiella arboris]MXV51048.1 hypothetical protein [Hufsiella arboris]
MKSILLKVDDKLFEETEAHAKELKTSRNGYIKKALEVYNKWAEKKQIEDQLRREVLLLKKSDTDAALSAEFEEASLTDLEKYLDD